MTLTDSTNPSYHCQAVGQADGWRGRGRIQGGSVERVVLSLEGNIQQVEPIWPETVDWESHAPCLLPELLNLQNEGLECWESWEGTLRRKGISFDDKWTNTSRKSLMTLCGLSGSAFLIHLPPQLGRACPLALDHQHKPPFHTLPPSED